MSNLLSRTKTAVVRLTRYRGRPSLDARDFSLMYAFTFVRNGVKSLVPEWYRFPRIA